MKTKLKDITVRDIIALVIVIGSFFTLHMFMFYTVPDMNRDLMSFAFGAVVATTLPNVVRSYFPTKQEDKMSTIPPTLSNTQLTENQP